jgi:hypothetical protein
LDRQAIKGETMSLTLKNIIDTLQLTVLTEEVDFSAVEPHGGYMSDLLSCVMAGARTGNIWITLQAHINVIAVAALQDLAAVIITENAPVEPQVVQKANQQAVILLSTPLPSYEVAGRLWEMGLRPD